MLRPPVGRQISSPLGQSKAEATEPFKRWLTGIGADSVCVFSDGSSDGPARSAWGFTIRRGGSQAAEELACGSAPMPGAEVFDAEVEGALRGLEAALRLRPQARERVYVLLDNQAAAHALLTGWASSSQSAVASFHRLLRDGKVDVIWVPGHSGVRGNDRADELAKAALRELPGHMPTTWTFAATGRWCRARCQELVERWWAGACPPRYKHLGLEMSRTRPPELDLPRRILARLYASRTGHGDFAEYHTRFHHEDAVLLCSCGRRKTPGHFVECRKALARWRDSGRQRRPPGRLEDLLGPKGWKVFAKFVVTTGVFSDVPIGAIAGTADG